jgi:hypothetical protein
MEQITTVKIIDDEIDLDTNESDIYVVLDTRWSSMPSREANVAEDTRNGMTVPLNHMEECMSLWPTGQEFATHLRVWFENGVEAVRNDGLVITAPNIQNWDFDYLVSKRKPLQRTANFRSDNLTHRVIKNFLPGVSDRAGWQIQELLCGWDERQREDLKTYTENKTKVATLYLRPAALAELQAFLLGYYYELLRPLVDCSRLSVQKVHGAWGYTSSAFLTAVSRLKRRRNKSPAQRSFPARRGERALSVFPKRGYPLSSRVSLRRRGAQFGGIRSWINKCGHHQRCKYNRYPIQVDRSSNGNVGLTNRATTRMETVPVGL